MSERKTIGSWVRELPKRGVYTFTLEDVIAEFPGFTKDYIHLELFRQAEKGEVKSVWRGFYAVVLDDYGLRGDPPPTEFIDQLMRYLDRHYYVALLSAASFHGSSHQAPQTFMVMVEGSSMRMSNKSGSRMKFYTRKKIPKNYLDSVMSKSGYITFSSIELTALDLIVRMKGVGGLNRAAEVIDGLVEEDLRFNKVEADFFELSPAVSIQRLGYILDKPLGYTDIADELYEGAMKAGVRFKHTLLYPIAGISAAGYSIDSKWKVAANKEVELD